MAWLDKESAARAIIGLSKHVKGLEKFHSKADPFLKEGEKEKESDKENEKEEVVVVQEIEKPDGDDIIMVMERSRPVYADEQNANEVFSTVYSYEYNHINEMKSECVLIR